MVNFNFSKLSSINENVDEFVKIEKLFTEKLKKVLHKNKICGIIIKSSSEMKNA